MRSDSCPGTPREYRARQQQRYAAEKLSRQQEQAVIGATASEISVVQTALPHWSSREALSLQDHSEPAALLQVEQVQSNCATSSGNSPASPPTPRQRGSASLRAISAARAMRMADAVPLAGAAWPGHSQEPCRSEAAGYKASVLPPRPPAPSSTTSPSLRRSSSRSVGGLPPRPRASSTTHGQSMRRSLSSCAQAVGATNDRTLNLALLCY